MNDLKFAIRQLLKYPGFTAVAVVTLALGIGANTAIFSIVNAVLLKPLPFPGAERITMIHTTHEREGRREKWEVMFDPDFKEVRDQNSVFEQVAAYGSGQATLISGGDPERVASAEVTIDFFQLLGAKPLTGRTFQADEHLAGGARAAILSENLWRDRFGANPSVVGQGITLDGRNATVVGVLPRQFSFPSGCDVWTPLVLDTRRNNALHRVLGKLKPGVSEERAQAELDTIASRLSQAFSDPGLGATLVPLQELIVGGTRPLLLSFLGAVGFVLLIACANIANLLLARAAARRREIQIRVALGASQARVTRQLLTESVLLALIGGVLGLVLAYFGLALLMALIPPNLVPRTGEIRLDASVFGFNFCLSLLAGITFGLVPAWQASRADANEALKEGSRANTVGVRHRYLRQTLVASEITISVVLLIGAGLMVKSFARLREVKLGFNPENTLTMNISLPNADYPELPRIKTFYREALDRIRALPGVSSVGFANAVPLGDGGIRLSGDFAAADQQVPENLWASKVAVSPDYFRAMGIPLLKGRDFEELDGEQGAKVAIINEGLARRLWADGDPLGRRIQLGIGGPSQPWLDVVGVVGDVRQDSLRAEPPGGIFVPYGQVAHRFFLETMTIVVRTVGEPGEQATAIRRAIQTIDPTLPVFDVRTMNDLVSAKVSHPRFNTWLLGSFSAIALAMTLVGIYGVVSYDVSQRTQEIGIRMALGAQAREVVRLIMCQGMKPVLLGLLCGAGLAAALTRFLTSQLYAVTPTDPVTFVCVVLAFVCIALAACLVPAWRALGIDPIVALREE